MKKLYLLAAFAMAAFLVNAQTVAPKKSLKTSVKSEFVKADFAHAAMPVAPAKVLSVEELKKAEVEAEAKKSAAKFERSTRAYLNSVLKNRTNPAARCLGTFETALDASSLYMPSKAAPRYAGPRQAADVDEYGVIYAPEEGVESVYRRSSVAVTFYKENGKLYYTYQAGKVSLIETAEGDVYVKDFINSSDDLKELLGMSTYEFWLKGTKQGNKIVFPANQNVLYIPDESDPSQDLSIQVNTFEFVNGEGFTLIEDADIVLELKGDSLVLQNSYFTGTTARLIAYSLNGSFVGYGDAATVLNPYVAEERSRELVELPEGLTTETWTAEFVNVKNETSNSTVQIAKESLLGVETYYIKGLAPRFYPDAWIKGLRLGNKLMFPAWQYLGVFTYEGESYESWAIGYDDKSGISDIIFTVDDAEGTITLDNVFLANSVPDDDISYMEAYLYITLQQPKEVTYNVPFTDSITTNKQIANYLIVDANKDGKTWEIFNQSAAYRYHNTNAANDWLITPEIAGFEAGKTYTVTLNARAANAKYIEKYQIKVGKERSVEGLTTLIVDTTEINNPVFDEYSYDFTVAESGSYYIGVHAVSDVNRWNLFVNAISVKEYVEGVQPLPLQNADITPGDKGALKATVSFDAPSKGTKDEDITEPVKVSILVDNVEKTILTVAAGSKDNTYDFTVEKPGIHTVTLIPYVVEGKPGKKTIVSAYLGVDVPAYIKTVAIKNKVDNLALTWINPGSVGENEGYVDSVALTYNVYSVAYEQSLFGEYPVKDQKLNSAPITDTAYVVSYPEALNGEQKIYELAVTAENEAGESEESFGQTLVGKPYALPFYEDFDGDDLTYFWGYKNNGFAKVLMTDTGDGHAIVLVGDTTGIVDFQTGMISLEGADKPLLSFTSFGFHDTPIKLIVETDQLAEQEIAVTTSSDLPNTLFADLAPYTNANWLRIYFRGEFAYADTIILDKVAILDQKNNNLAVSLTAPAKVAAGNVADVNITVQNLGSVKASKYAVKLYADDVVIAEVDADKSVELPYLAKALYKAKYKPSVFDKAGDVTLRAEVVFAADEDEIDNADEVEITVLDPIETTIESISAHSSDKGLEVSWIVSEATVKSIVEDFESYDDQQIVKDGESLNGWYARDVDEGLSYGISNSEWAFSGKQYAFAVWNPSVIFGEDPSEFTYMVNGLKSALFMAAEPDYTDLGKNDDWMISPELPGFAQTVKFKIGEYDDYDEVFEVYYSTTDREISSFKFLKKGVANLKSMTQVEAELPEGTKYFAIRYVGEDLFILTVDDIEYQTYSQRVPSGFNIYVNEALVATVGADATTYEYESELSEGTYKVSVTALYDGAESAPLSESVAVSAIENLAVEAKAADVYNMMGIRVRSDKNLNSGIYVIGGQKAAVK